MRESGRWTSEEAGALRGTQMVIHTTVHSRMAKPTEKEFTSGITVKSTTGSGTMD